MTTLPRPYDPELGRKISQTARDILKKTFDCSRCQDTGWLEGKEGYDGSYITCRPCPCGKYEGLRW